MPDTIVCDRDPKFTSNFWKTLFRLLGTKITFSTAYHPQTDGQTERANQTLEQILRMYIGYKQTDWDQHLPNIEFAINNATAASTGMSPFLVNYGQHPRTPATITSTQEPVQAVAEFTEQIKIQMQKAQQAIETAQKRQKKYSDQ